MTATRSTTSPAPAEGSPVGRVTREMGGATRTAAASPWMARLARLGYAVRGLLYLTVGGLALGVASGLGGATTTTEGALGTLAGLPVGRALLAVIAVGLAGYALWGFVRAFFDPLGRGSDPGGLAQRAGYVCSGISYGLLVLPAVQLLIGAASAADGPPAMASVLTVAGGPWVLAALGAAWIAGAGIGQLWQAYTASFRKDFETWQMSPDQIKWATRLGRLGLTARGVVFGLMGWFLIEAARQDDAARAKGLDGALQTLAAQPHGPWLLGVAAAGLVCFGLYSLCCARWIKLARAG